MKLEPWIVEAIGRGAEYSYKNLNSFKHNAINLGVLASWLGLILLVIKLETFFPGWTSIFYFGIIFGFLFFGLFILVVHEAAHNMFLIFKSSKKRLFWNKVFGWIICIPFGVDFSRHWLEGHLVHHWYPMETGDPQICNPLTGKDLLKEIGKVVFIPGYLFVKGLWHGKGTEYECSNSNESRFYFKGIILFLVFWATSLSLGSILIDGFIWYKQFFSYFFGAQILGALTVIKTALEHGGKLRENSNPYFRQRSSRFLFSDLLLPFNFCFHFEHHLNYTVPWYKIRKYHKAIRNLVPSEIENSAYARDPFDQLRGKGQRYNLYQKVLVKH